ncbi:AbiEi_3_N domain-containing protein [Nitrospira tepida]|uniref:AbiEi_3_N domain-containing protein n=1 Tax=Nitrospira tepida TaxID=2973512 RepID=A0AA86MX96_9BACT|nr:type IV toxin-antitoxin system AbiEi family antitoxin domain-containing protein [Nitrospira tepida]CAI4030746.1 AbiEi_3_N domain-containing protein [Nitrospira tepida]
MALPSKKTSLDRLPPEGQLVNRAWLRTRGVTRPLVDFWLRSGKLEAVSHGLYRRPGPPLKWEQVVYSVNEMGVQVHVGGRTALELQGLAHYLPLQGVTRVSLYTTSKVPPWVQRFPADYTFTVHRGKLFKTLPGGALVSKPFGAWDWPVPYATVELALLEYLADVRTEDSFDFADKFFEGASVLRPALIRELLLSCSHVLAKRLFLWFAERHEYAWFKKLDTTGVDLGHGKRAVVKGGALDTKYLITVPRTMVHGHGQPVY